ncbi:MAG: hypothetical protein WC558_10775 [Patulibacter sp.]
MSSANVEPPRGFGPRRGWRAPKGGTGRPARRTRSAGDRLREAPAPARATDSDPGSLAGPIARLLDLTDDEAERAAAFDLPAPGSPSALTGLADVARQLLADARQAIARAEQATENANRQRARDAQRAQTRVERADERARRHERKAVAEQGERQRLAGELERTQARSTAVGAESEHLRQQLDMLRKRPERSNDASGSTDGAQVAGLLARIAALEQQQEQRSLLVEHLIDRSELAEAEAERLLVSARNLRRLALEAGASEVDLVDPEDQAPLDAGALPAVRTVLEAVELAAAHAEHLIYTERAFETARTAPYSEPQKLLRDLVALDRVAAAWAVEGGVGRPMRDIAVEQQLDWADDVSDAARGQHPHEYLFSHDGRQLWAGPHVRVANGRGLQRVCRIYMALVKGGEADLAGLPRGIYVGPVGRHLSDSTSG